MIIGGKAQVKATGSAEHCKYEDVYDYYNSFGAGAAIGNGGTTSRGGTVGTVQNGKNQFTIANDIVDNAK